MSEPSAREIAGCVKINVENLAKIYPQVKTHLFFLLAMDQLNDVIKRLEEE